MNDVSPPICLDSSHKPLVRADIVFPNSYKKPCADYISADNVVGLLYIEALQNKNDEAINILLELAGNYWNKSAFNVLNS